MIAAPAAGDAQGFARLIAPVEGRAGVDDAFVAADGGVLTFLVAATADDGFALEAVRLFLAEGRREVGVPAIVAAALPVDLHGFLQCPPRGKYAGSVTRSHVTRASRGVSTPP